MPTYSELSRQQLLALSEAVGQSDASPGYIALQEALLSPWGTRQVPNAPTYPSQIGDDHSPYEYSVAYEPGHCELRLLFEAQAATPCLRKNHEEALRVNERLRLRYGASLSRLEQIADLFPVSSATAHGFSLWHAVCLSPSGAPQFKVYLNPQLQGREVAEDVVREIFVRLGLRDAHQSLQALRCRGTEQDELKYISLDLSDAPQARLKVYVCHHQARPRDLERSFSTAPTHRRGDAAHFCEQIATGTHVFDRKPVSSCLAFVAGKSSPYSLTMHLPIAHYVESDAVARRRIGTFMRDNRMDELVHSRVLRAISRRPLEQSTCVQSYASYRRQGEELRLTVYLSPELFRGWDASSPTRLHHAQ